MLRDFNYKYAGPSNNYGKSYTEDVFPEIYPARNYAHVSRYKNTPRLLDTLFSEYYHQFGQSYDIRESSTDTYTEITNNSENRLDIIALQYYNNPLFWWVIAGANNIEDAFNVPVGTVLRIPSLRAIYEIGGILA